MYTVEPIQSEEQYAQVKRLWTVHARLMRTKVPERTDLNVGSILAAYKDDDLVATLRHNDWEGQLAYSIDSLYVKPGEMYMYDFANPMNPVTPLLDHVLGLREANRYFTWYYTRAISPGYAKIQKNGHDLLANSKLGHRYERYVHEIVPAGKRSQVKAHDMMLGSRSYDKNIMVVQCCLKNDLRPWGDIITDESKYF